MKAGYRALASRAGAASGCFGLSCCDQPGFLGAYRNSATRVVIRQKRRHLSVDGHEALQLIEPVRDDDDIVTTTIYSLNYDESVSGRGNVVVTGEKIDIGS